jgi:methylmalonyl-CoA/ethylmalonyl-CoA epimerase
MDAPRLSHIAIACPEIEKLSAKLAALALEIAEEHDVPTEKVKAAMIPFEVSPEVRIELLEPTAPDSPIAKFLSKRPDGGLHHLCFEVTGLEQWKQTLEKRGFEVLPPGIRKAARGRALFIHPRSFGGVLVELEEMETGGH